MNFDVFSNFVDLEQAEKCACSRYRSFVSYVSFKVRWRHMLFWYGRCQQLTPPESVVLGDHFHNSEQHVIFVLSFSIKGGYPNVRNFWCLFPLGNARNARIGALRVDRAENLQRIRAFSSGHFARWRCRTHGFFCAQHGADLHWKCADVVRVSNRNLCRINL